MWTFILHMFSVFNLVKTDFSFFYQESVPKTTYQDNIIQNVKVTFPFTKEMSYTSKNISTIYTELVTPFNMTQKDFKKRSNPIYIQMDDLYNWLEKFYNVYDNFKNATTNYKQFDPKIFDKSQIITIDANYQEQKFANMKLFANMIIITFNKYDTLPLLIANTEDLTLTITTLELLMTDLKHYVGVFYDTYQSLNLAKQGHLSEMLQEHLLDKTKTIDLTKTVILEGGSNNNIATFIVRVVQKAAPITYYELKPISYFGYSLENDYYVIKSESEIRKFYVDDNLNPQQMFKVKNCLSGLNQKEFGTIFEHCTFIKTNTKYQIVSKGIIFNNGSTDVITQLNTMFHKNLKEIDFPIIIHYNGTFLLKDHAHNKIPILKKSPNLFQKSNLNITTLDHLKETLFLSNDNKLMTLLEEEITGVIISLVSVTILFIGYYLTRCIYRKYKSSKTTQKPQEKLLLKKLRATKKY